MKKDRLSVDGGGIFGLIRIDVMPVFGVFFFYIDRVVGLRSWGDVFGHMVNSSPASIGFVVYMCNTALSGSCFNVLFGGCCVPDSCTYVT